MKILGVKRKEWNNSHPHSTSHRFEIRLPNGEKKNLYSPLFNGYGKLKELKEAIKMAIHLYWE